MSVALPVSLACKAGKPVAAVSADGCGGAALPLVMFDESSTVEGVYPCALDDRDDRGSLAVPDAGGDGGVDSDGSMRRVMLIGITCVPVDALKAAGGEWGVAWLDAESVNSCRTAETASNNHSCTWQYWACCAC